MFQVNNEAEDPACDCKYNKIFVILEQQNDWKRQTYNHTDKMSQRQNGKLQFRNKRAKMR